MFYFDHDTGASKDSKIVALRMTHGSVAVDAYWSILECLYETETNFVLDRNLSETKALTLWLMIDFDKLSELVEGMVMAGLLAVPDEVEEALAAGENIPLEVYSPRARERIAKLQKKAETARQNGKSGGRKPKENQSETDAEPSDNQEQTQEGGDLRLKTLDLRPKKERGRFAAPTPDQVAEYASEKGLALDPHRFCDYYESNGWRVGKSPMKDWKAAARNWAAREKPKGVALNDEDQFYAGLL